MPRPRIPASAPLAPVLLFVVAFAAACSGPPEEPILQRFFRASAARDNTTLSNFAVVAFEPKTDGTISTFTITNVTPDRTEPFRTKELAKAYEDVQAAERKFTDEKLVYQNANVPALNRVLAAEFGKKPVETKDLGVQAEWNKWREQTQAWSKKIAEAKAALADSRVVPEVSLASLPPEQVPDLVKADGEVTSKDVTIDATVRTPDGKSEPRTLVITLSQARLKGATPEGLAGRWVIASIKKS